MSLNSLKTKNRQITKSGTNRNPKTLTVLNLARLAIFGLICLLQSATAFGQSAEYTNNAADQKLRGSGRVNASSLAMEFSLPLGNYPGRGINMPINLSYSSKVWRMAYNGTQPNPVGGGCHSVLDPKYAERSASGWTTSLAVPFIEYTGAQSAYLSSGEVYYDDVELACDPLNPTNPTKYYIRRVTLHLPSGETHELRMSDTEVEFSSTWDGTYYAADGSNIIYKQDSANNIFKVMMPDGSAYDLNTGSGTTDRYANKYTDRNGNFTTYHNDDTTNYPNGYWKDTLGKNIRIPLKPQAPTSAATQTYSIPSISGNVSYTFHWKQLKGSSAAESGLTNFSDSLQYLGDKYYDNGWYNRTSGFLFDSSLNEWIISYDHFNPIVLTRIDLPNGEKYKFTYNVHGEIETIKYPTGGEEKFVYGLVQPLSFSSLVYYQSNRGVTNRKVYETAGTGTPSEWDYATTATTASEYIITTTNPDDTKNVRFLHRGDVNSLFGFDNALAGIPYREFSFSSAGALQTQKFTYWTKSGGERHPRVVRGDNIIYDATGNGLSSTAIYEYEGDLSYKETPVLVDKTTAYAFETVSGGSSITPTSLPTATPPTLPSAPSIPVRITETTYLINDANITSTVRDEYKNRNMIGLATTSQVKNGSGTTIVSRSEIVYDDSTNYPIISAGTSSRWQNPNTNYRGNPTTLKVWDSTKGAETSSGAYISTHAQFDNFGNQRKAWDALGNLTETAFSSTYDYAFPTSVTTTAPDQNGGTYGSTTGFTTSATFDPTTGLPLTTTNINGQVTEMEYDAATLRLETVTAPNGHTTEYVYGAPDSTTGVYAAAQRFVKTRTQIDASSWKESYSWVDGLGRAEKGREINSTGNVEAKTEYDIMGRVKRSTNPYRIDSSGNPTETVYWTTPTYDALGRTIEVASPDTATVQMAYGISTSGVVGLTKTVTDQASKKREGITDALGNMIRVIEDPDSQALVTDYVFDTLGNLRKTTQTEGQTTQNRYFSYDSLSRLLRAKQPEQDVNTNLALSTADAVTGHNQWSVKYVYDDNGNITSTTDARNKTITATYDHLNRLILRDYSDSTMPDATFYYDGKGLGSVPNHSKGKLTRVSSSVSTPVTLLLMRWDGF